MTRNNKPSTEEHKKEWRRFCRKCKKEMEMASLAGVMEGLFAPVTFYCNNNKCPRFGDITIAGLEAGIPIERKIYDEQ